MVKVLIFYAYNYDKIVHRDEFEHSVCDEVVKCDDSHEGVVKDGGGGLLDGSSSSGKGKTVCVRKLKKRLEMALLRKRRKMMGLGKLIYTHLVP